MFEKLVIRRSKDLSGVTAGQIAEGLLFYQNVHIVFDYSSLYSMIEKLGVEGVLRLVNRPNVSAVYSESFPVVKTDTFGLSGTKRHMLTAVTPGGDDTTGNLETKEARLAHVLFRLGHSKTQSKKNAEALLEAIPSRENTDSVYASGGVISAAINDIKDQTFLQNAARVVLAQQFPTHAFPATIDLEIIHPDHQHFFVFSNINFEQLSNETILPGQFTAAHLLAHVLEARVDTSIASFYGGDFQTSDLSSAILRLRFSELLRRGVINQNEIQQFDEIVMSNCRSLKEVIDSGERTFDEYLELLDNSKLFKRWVANVGPDTKLVTEYIGAISNQAWIEKLQGKSLRYVVSTAVGVLEPLTGAVVSAADSFLLGKVFGGWRPSHFVDSRLKPFVRD